MRPRHWIARVLQSACVCVVQSRSKSPLRPAIQVESLGEAARDAGDEAPLLQRQATSPG